MKNVRNGLIGLFLCAVATGVLVSCGGGGGSSAPAAAATYTVGGTVSGLSGTVVLQLNGAGNLSISASGGFTFTGPLANGSNYAVTVLAQPATQTCSVASGTGTLAGANVTNVSVTCATNTTTVGGTISGSTGTVVLKLNGGGDIPMASPGSFTFAGALASGSTYNVQVVASNQRCTVANGAGTAAGVNITNVSVTCGAQAAQMVIRSTVLTGALQNPPVTTAATGVGGLIVDPTTKAITGGITFSGLTATAQHIHQAPIGNPTADGGVIIGLILASDGKTAVVPPGVALTQAQYDALLAGELYFNVHTLANGNGEIRGQITLQGGVVAGLANLTGAQEVPAVTTAATGQGTLLVDAATRTILITYITHNVTNADMAHIHTSLGPTTNGAVRVGFSNLQTNFFSAGSNFASPLAGSQMTAQDMLDFAANYLYFNVHSTANGNPGGEIRGNFAPIP